MKLETLAFGTSPTVGARLLHLLVVLIALGLAAMAAGALWDATWVGWMTLAAVLIAARKLHPQVKTRWFFMPARRRFAFLAWLIGALAMPAIADTFDAVAGRPGGSLWLGLLWLVLSTSDAFCVLLVFEGKIMGSIFKLAPPASEGLLLSKLRALDAARFGMSGQAANFSGLDAAKVIASIKDRVIGQDPTVEAVVHTAFRRARVARPMKPVATFLLVGATGAGKTELAKALATELFAGRMIRIDCSEMSAEHSVQRLIGSPPGYVGSDQGGWLCRELARVGTGVLLLDEIEKAHPVVLRTLMSLLDEARLTEQSTNKTYSARGFLVVLTSNAAHEAIAEVARVESDPTLRSVKVRDALKQAGFLPEILGRIDQVFAFAPLSAEGYCKVVEKFLIAFGAETGVEVVQADPELLLELVTKALKTRDYGVREVVRAVENAVTDGLIAAKDAGYSRAAIHVIDGQVRVEGVAENGNAAA